jgi:hypothetical protein
MAHPDMDISVAHPAADLNRKELLLPQVSGPGGLPAQLDLSYAAAKNVIEVEPSTSDVQTHPQESSCTSSAAESMQMEFPEETLDPPPLWVQA